MTPEMMVRQRVHELSCDRSRLGALVDEVVRPVRGDLARTLDILLSRLDASLMLDSVAGMPASGETWRALGGAQRQSRDFCRTMLELLGGFALAGALDGGSAMDDGFTRLAQNWLDGLRERVGVTAPLIVVPGLGPPYEPELGLVHAPFPGADLWRLPLLAHAVGLQVAAEDEAGTSAILESLEAEARATLGNRPDLPPDAAQVHVRALLADMMATAVAGPAYPLAYSVLDLNFAEPHQLGLGDPSAAELPDHLRCCLPSAAQRVTAMLETLRRLDQAAAPESYRKGPYESVVADLTALLAASTPGGMDPPPAGGQWLDVLFDQAVQPRLGFTFAATQETWEWAGERCSIWDGSHAPKANGQGVTICQVLNALWRYKLCVPDRDDQLQTAGQRLLEGMSRPLPSPVRKLGAGDIAQTRLHRLERRWDAIRVCLGDERLPAASRTAVSGRFLRLLSEQLYLLGEARNTPAAGSSAPVAWADLARLEEQARPVLREALEFIGAALLAGYGLDQVRRPARAGPPTVGVTALADEILADYAQRTGVGRGAHTILGTQPLLETATDVIRVRFPDLGPWSLVLIAHEFGHLVARDTAAFSTWQARQVAKAASGEVPAGILSSRLEELFADVFATYIAGPAFACATVVLYLDPVSATASRGGHPSHADRVDAILGTLHSMNDEERLTAAHRGPYDDVLAELDATWSAALTKAGTPPNRPWDGGARQPAARELGVLVRRYYRLGAGYRPERWNWAQKFARQLLQAPGGVHIAAQADTDTTDRPRLGDLLNALWAARMAARVPLPALTDAAARLTADCYSGVPHD